VPRGGGPAARGIQRRTRGFGLERWAARLGVLGPGGIVKRWLLQDGVSPKDVQETVGHSRVSVTLDMYWEATAGAQERVQAAIGEIVTPRAAPGYPEITPKKRRPGVA
jgi:hypothetical protein